MALIVLKTPAVLFKDEDGSYVCTPIPLNACSSGDTAKEAREMAEDAVLCLLEFWEERGIVADALRKHGFACRKESGRRIYEYAPEEIPLSQDLFESARRGVRFLELTVKFPRKEAAVVKAG
ncbi:type II toxin-antitoxin system HicB family antitoxin [bacterium]|nr:type II toxin-antitoxin system HicB family antitoxin [bacterium]